MNDICSDFYDKDNPSKKDESDEDELDDSLSQQEQSIPDPNRDDMYLVKQDTPINKATLLELDLDQQRQFIAVLQERRLRIKQYVTKAKKSGETARGVNKVSQAAKFEKLAAQLEKGLDDVEKKLTKLEKIADEIKILRMIQGEYDE